MQSTLLKIGLVQTSCSSDKQANREKAALKVREAASQGAKIVCLQELFETLYFCDVEDYANFNLAEPINENTTTFYQQLSAELGVVLIASLFEKRAEGIYHNTAAIIDADGKYLGKYRKNHIPDDPGFYEKFYFTPGDTGYKAFETKYGKIGVLICWDQWYPEAARITSLMGAQILFYPTAIGWALSQDEETNREQYTAWQTVQRGHAVANGVYVVAVNRVGTEGELKFWGGSFIATPFGALQYQASHDQEEVIVQEIDLTKSDYYRVHWPFMRDRRIETYQPILKRYIDES